MESLKKPLIISGFVCSSTSMIYTCSLVEAKYNDQACGHVSLFYLKKKKRKFALLAHLTHAYYTLDFRQAFNLISDRRGL